MTIRSYQYQVEVLVTPSSGSSVSRTVTDSAIVSDSVEAAVNAQFVSVNDPLSDLEQSLGWYLLPGGVNVLSDDLNLQQELSAFGFEFVTDDLNLTESVSTTGPVFRSVLHTTVYDSVDWGYKVRTFDLESELELTDAARTVIEFSVSHTNILTDEAFVSYTPSHELNLTQTINAGFGLSVSQTLGLQATVGRDVELNQSLTDSEVVSHQMTYFIDSKCNRYNFNSFHGVGGFVPSDEPLSYKSTFTVLSLDDGTLLQLRNPEVDDRRRYSYDRVNRNYLDGSLDLYADEDWLTEETQLYTIVAVKRADLDTLWQFLQDNLGREILIKDWKGQTWKSVITNPGELYTEDGEGYWTLNFEVLGERLPGEYVFDLTDLTETLSRAGSIYTRTASNGITFTRGEIANREFPLGVTDGSAVSQTVSNTVVSP